MAGQLGGSDSAGFSDIAAALAPLALMATGGRNSQAPQMLALLASLSKGREDRALDAAKLAREQASAGAMARIFGEAGLQVDPAMTGSDLAHSVTAQIAMSNAKRAQEKEQIAAAEAATTRGAHGKIASLTSQVGTELPDVLGRQASGLAGVATRDAGTHTAFKELMTAIADSKKRLADAQAAGRPYETVTDYEAAGVPQPVTVGGYSLGEQGTEPLLPEMKLKTVTPNVAAAQEYLYQTGPSTEKTAPGIEAAFNLTPGGLIGSREAARTLNAPVHAPFFETKQHNAAGDVTPFAGYITPEGKPTIERFEPLKGIATPQRPERPQEFEHKKSLTLIAEGQPTHPDVRAAYRGMSPAVAHNVLQTWRAADQQVNPSLAAAVIQSQIRELDAGLLKAEAAITAAKTARAKLKATMKRDEILTLRDGKRSLLDHFSTPGLPHRPSSSEPVEPEVDTDALQGSGYLKP